VQPVRNSRAAVKATAARGSATATHRRCGPRRWRGARDWYRPRRRRPPDRRWSKSPCVLPVEFLSDDQAAAYERFVGDLSRLELEGFFLLDSTAADLVANKRGDHNRLLVAVQIGTVRYLGHFLTEDPLEVPWSAVEYVAGHRGSVGDQAVHRAVEDGV
jgi:hypothetical protein